LHLYPGLEKTVFTHYEDDGDSFDYQEEKYLKRQLQYIPSENTVVMEKAEGSFSSGYRKLKLVFHHVDADAISVNGIHRNLVRHTHSFFTPIEKYDPINDPESMGEEEVKMAEVEYSTDRMEIRW
jgi:alpha-glucosidase